MGGFRRTGQRIPDLSRVTGATLAEEAQQWATTASTKASVKRKCIVGGTLGLLDAVGSWKRKRKKKSWEEWAGGKSVSGSAGIDGELEDISSISGKESSHSPSYIQEANP
jgi:hypothetical protein